MQILDNQEGNDLIKKNIKLGIPFIASKMGSVEQNILITKLNNNSYDVIRDMASANAGITPNDDSTLNFFYNEYTQALKNTDILGLMSTQNEKLIIPKFAKNAVLSQLRLLEPFYFDNPWSEELEDKNVLIIHPFESTIIQQYKKRESLFENKKILPKFNLLTIKAEQTNGGGKPDNKPFIDSLHIMKDKIDSFDFDIAIIGCGAYGLLLANYVKNKNKQAVHIGGGLQILFGIKGKRWDVHSDINKLYNQDWVRPSESEKTLNINLVEGGTYW